MSIVITPIITNAGLGVFTPSATGIEFTFTHVAVGTGISVASAANTALENEIARFPIAGGGINTDGKSASINALITNHTNANPQNYDISEFGFYGLDSANNTVLFAIYRQALPIVSKVSGVDIATPFSLALSALPANNITIQIDNTASLALALLGQHTASSHPHTQYKRTNDNSERLKISDGVAVDDAASKGQLDDEATTRANNDLALSIALAAEITNRENLTNQATESSLGISKTATLAQTIAGLLDTVSVTPLKLKDGYEFNYNPLTDAWHLILPRWLGSFIFQGGIKDGTTSNGATITFDIPFPNKCLIILPMPNGEYDSTYTENINIKALTESDFQWHGSLEGVGSSNVTGKWIAVGF